MKANGLSVIILVMAIAVSGCGSGDCQSDELREASGLSLLNDAELIRCEGKADLYSVGLFQLTKKQVRELLDSGNFKPVRSSLEMVDYPIWWVNKIFAEVDQLSRYSPVNSDELHCSLVLKEDTRQLVVLVSYGE